MSLPISLDALRERVGGESLGDPALQGIADAAWNEILRKFGPPTGRVETYQRSGSWTSGREIILQRKASSVSSVRERWTSEDAWVVTDPSKYLLQNNGAILLQVESSWSQWAEVTYDTGETDTYIGVLVDLVSLRLPQSGWRARDESPEDPWGNPTQGGAVTGTAGAATIAASGVAMRGNEVAIFARLKRFTVA